MKVAEQTRAAATNSAGRLHRLAAELAEHGFLGAAEIVSGGALALTGILRILAAEAMPETKPGEGPALRAIGEEEPCNEKQL